MVEGILLALSPLGICSMLAGGVIGLVIGMLPGLGPVFGVALLLPFTFWMPAHLGLVFLASLYSCCVYGGSIPAVLLGIPGTTGSITTVFDGHELAKKCRAGVGLGLSATSSMLGGVVGAISLGVLAPLLAEFALTFSPADFFALAVLTRICFSKGFSSSSSTFVICVRRFSIPMKEDFSLSSTAVSSNKSR